MKPILYGLTFAAVVCGGGAWIAWLDQITELHWTAYAIALFAFSYGWQWQVEHRESA